MVAKGAASVPGLLSLSPVVGMSASPIDSVFMAADVG